MKSVKIRIPKPCTEDWESMTQEADGKHCEACNKVVIDFTQMTNDEIVKYLITNKGKKICGNFYNTQINTTITHIQKRNINKWPAIAAMLVAGVFQVNSSVAWSQNKSNQNLYSREMAFEKNPVHNKDTEPASDSLISYTIQVFSEKDKKIIQGINIEIDSVGSFITNRKGEVVIQVDSEKLPSIIKIQVLGIEYETENLSFPKSKLINNQKISIYLKEKTLNREMFKGDISIDYESH